MNTDKRHCWISLRNYGKFYCFKPDGVTYNICGKTSPFDESTRGIKQKALSGVYLGVTQTTLRARLH